MVGTIIGGAAQLGSAIYGAAKSSQLNNRSRQMLRDQKNKTKQWYDQKLDEDYLSRTDVQSALTKQKQILDEKYKQAEATKAVAGGTEEGVALQKKMANDSLAESTRSIAAQAAGYKSGLAQGQLNAENAFVNEERRDLQKQADAVAQAAAQVGQATGGLADTIGKKKA